MNMGKTVVTIITVTCGPLFSGCVQDMQRINQGLGSVNAAMGGGSTGSYGTSAMPVISV